MPRTHIQHSGLPVKGDKGDKFTPNWLSLQRSLNNTIPVCITVNPGGSAVVVGTGGLSLPVPITWFPNPNFLRDQYQFIGPSSTQNLRIPFDGYYDFWIILDVFVPVFTGNCELTVKAETANTSDTGLAAPVWTQSGPIFSRTYLATTFIDTAFQFLHRGQELHANDLMRFMVQINSPDTIEIGAFGEFRFAYPIPNLRPV